MKTFKDEFEARNYLKFKQNSSLAIVDGPCEGEFTVMMIENAEEFGAYIGITRNGKFYSVTIED